LPHDRTGLQTRILSAQQRRLDLELSLKQYDDESSAVPEFSPSISVLLYDVWSNHGIMGKNGGFLEQDGAWLSTIIYMAELTEYHDLEYDIFKWKNDLRELSKH